LCRGCARTKPDTVPGLLRALEQELRPALPQGALDFSPSGLTLYFGA